MSPRTARAAAALLFCVVWVPSACSSRSRPSLPSPSIDIAFLNEPSAYMSQAVLHYNAVLDRHEGPPYFPAVRSEGQTWTGDPGYYERLCGARIANADGSVVDVLDAGAYLDLVHNPRRWATFNAWLQDPAIYGYFERWDSFALQGYSKGRAVGSTAACPAFHSVAPPPISRH